MMYTEIEYEAMVAKVREAAASQAATDWTTYLDTTDAAYPEPDLSGEWADGWTPKDVAQVAGLYRVAGAMYENVDEADYSDKLSDLCDEYEDAYRERIAVLGGNEPDARADFYGNQFS